MLGTGSNTVTALGGLSTVVLGATVTLPEGDPTATFSILTATGKDTVTINGSYNTVNLATDTLAGTHDRCSLPPAALSIRPPSPSATALVPSVSLNGGGNTVVTGTGGTSSIDFSASTAGDNVVETEGTDNTIKLNGFDNLVSAVPGF